MLLNNALPIDPGVMLNTQQAADRLGLTVHALERWRVRGGGVRRLACLSWQRPILRISYGAGWVGLRG